MVNADQLHNLLARSRRLPLLILVSILVGLALAIFLTARFLRENTRTQIISRDGEILTAVARMQADSISGELGESDILQEVWVQQMVLLESSRLAGVLGTRLFDPAGRFVETFPPQVLEARLPPPDLPKLQSLQPVSHYHPSMPLHNLFYPETNDWSSLDTTQPILLVNVPLHTSEEGKLTGIAQFILQGQTIAAEFRRLDRNLLAVSLVIFAVMGLLIGVVTGWSLHRLRQTNQQLADRTRQLVTANQELALATKTSAVGALTSHLIHGLKNPLSGLQNFVNNLENGAALPNDTDWQDAVASTRRMQALINQVVGVLHEQESDHQFQIDMRELVEIIRPNLEDLARGKRVQLQFPLETNESLNNRASSLVALILVNLLQNALQAAPPGSEVVMKTRQEKAALVWEVIDQGPGIPGRLRPTLFQPCRSSKEGGSGIGLALSKQLATHLGASLELKTAASDVPGCRFVLRLPLEPRTE